jgi:hypothetical protein
MLKDIVAVKVVRGYQLQLRFEDGIEGVVDVSHLIEFTGVFEPLRDPAYFSEVRLNPEWGTIYWPNGADLDPDVLYSHVAGEPLPQFEVHVPGEGNA